jgi:hypothetical protein
LIQVVSGTCSVVHLGEVPNPAWVAFLPIGSRHVYGVLLTALSLCSAVHHLPASPETEPVRFDIVAKGKATMSNLDIASLSSYSATLSDAAITILHMNKRMVTVEVQLFPLLPQMCQLVGIAPAATGASINSYGRSHLIQTAEHIIQAFSDCLVDDDCPASLQKAFVFDLNAWFWEFLPNKTSAI